MNKTEYLLTKISEECSEIGKECCKAILFGLDDKNPEDPLGDATPTNRRKIADEMVDLLAVYMMCVALRILPDLELHTGNELVKAKIVAKVEKVFKYMEYSKGKRTLEQEGEL